MPNASVQLCDDPAGRAVPATSAQVRRPDSLHVLLVEDDDVDARLIEIYAASMRLPKVVIERAVSAAEAQKLLLEWSFDLCILDFWLGCESSLRLLVDLAGLEVVPPAIVLTSLSTPDIHQMCQRAGATSFVGKESLTPALLERAILEAVRAAPRAKPAPKGSEDGLVGLMTTLLDGLAAGRLGEAGPSRSDDRHLARSALRRRLGPLLDMTETARFGFFEKMLADRGASASTRGDVGIDDVGRFMAVAVELARGVIDCRGQTLVFQPPEGAVGAACDPSTFMFLMFELVNRASQQSASNSQIRVRLKAEADALLVRFTSDVPAHPNAGAVAFGPLVAQILSDLQGLVRTALGSNGRIDLDVSFRALSRDGVAPTTFG